VVDILGIAPAKPAEFVIIEVEQQVHRLTHQWMEEILRGEIMAPKHDDQPYEGFHFLLTINGIGRDGSAVTCLFSEVSGLERELSPIECREGSENRTVRKMPGSEKLACITLKRGVISDLELYEWVVGVKQGKINRAAGSLILLDEKRNKVMQWNISRCLPSKCTGPSWRATGNEIAIEELVICHEGISVDSKF